MPTFSRRAEASVDRDADTDVRSLCSTFAMVDAQRLDGLVIACSESALLHDWAHLWLSRHIDVADSPIIDPERLPSAVRNSGGRLKRVLLLLDPRGDDWPRAVGKVRAIDRRLGVVVLTARATYWRQRQWRQRPEGLPDRYLTDGMLSLDDAPKLLLRALAESLEEPGTETRVWLPEPKHPAAFSLSAGGVALDAVPRTSAALAALELEIAGRGRRDAAHEAGVGYDAVQRALRRLKDDLGIESDAAVGYHLTRLGVFDDPPVR